MNTSKSLGYIKSLKLGYDEASITEFLTRAKANEMEPAIIIEKFLERACEERMHNGILRRIKRANFPYEINFDAFKTAHLNPKVKKQVKNLYSLEFMEEASNIVIVGNPGVGKTALSVALGVKACHHLKNVLFLNVPDLIIKIKEAMSLNQISRLKTKFEKTDLVILDDLGYVSFDKESGDILFNLLASRVEKKSTIITTNLTIDKWNTVFADSTITGVIVDRICCRSHMVDMTGNSYRVLKTKIWNNSERKEIAK